MHHASVPDQSSRSSERHDDDAGTGSSGEDGYDALRIGVRARSGELPSLTLVDHQHVWRSFKRVDRKCRRRIEDRLGTDPSRPGEGRGDALDGSFELT